MIVNWNKNRRSFIASKAQGNLSGLKPSQIKSINKLFTRRYAGDKGFSGEQARELAELTGSISRQLGLLINRKGVPVMVIVGDQKSIFIPELSRLRQSSGRLSGLRLLHTHIGSAALSEEDLMDMVFLRLDSVGVLTVSQGMPLEFEWAHLLPPNPDKKPYTVYPARRWDLIDEDFNAQAEALEDELARTGKELDTRGRDDVALLISVSTQPLPLQEVSLNELADLADTAGLFVAGRIIQRIRRINPKFILGKGKILELEVAALQEHADVLIFDQELSPAQMRNLAAVTERRVLDRTQLILDIFAQHATSKAGKLQVEMAQLKYTLPRLVGQNRALSRLAGGIGGRGPGETKLELDRRKIRNRIAQIKKELGQVRRHRQATRSRRRQANVPIISLVGYTNAGKSTLLNTLTNSGVLAADKLFATLDPSSRRLRFPQDREVVLTDTVGFIRELPEELKEAFMATLEELSEADVLVQVSDASHPEQATHLKSVEAILRELDIHELPRVLAFNKADLISGEQRAYLEAEYPEAVFITAKKRAGLGLFVQKVLELLPGPGPERQQQESSGLRSEYGPEYDPEYEIEDDTHE